MWLTNSSIGRKLVMALTGACLVLFLTFHAAMNAVCILWPTAYNQVCMFLGANWYALVASAGLAALIVLHIVYAIWLTLQNRKARGADRYEVSVLPPHVEWSSKNMLVLGIVVLAFICVHMIQFWAKMQLQEVLSEDPANWCKVDGACAAPVMGTLFIQEAFSSIWTLVVYVIGFVALWLHLDHGIWSMFQTTGWNGRTWLPRLKCIGRCWATIVVGLFLVEAVVFTVCANKKVYTTCPELQVQYAEEWNNKATLILEDYNAQIYALDKQAEKDKDAKNKPDSVNTIEKQRSELTKAFAVSAKAVTEAVAKQCPDVDLSGEAYAAIAELKEMATVDQKDAAEKLNKQANDLLDSMQDELQSAYYVLQEKYMNENMEDPEVLAQAQAEGHAIEIEVVGKNTAAIKAILDDFTKECPDLKVDDYYYIQALQHILAEFQSK